jgi:hypothetical protein
MTPISLISRPASCASLRASSLVSAYRPSRYPLSRRVPLARSQASSLNERLICEPPSSRPIYKAFEPRQSVVFDAAVVQPERKFVNVAVQMLRAGVMVDSYQPALQDGKDAFDAIGCRLAANVFASAVIDRIVVVSREVNARVCAAFSALDARSLAAPALSFNRPEIWSPTDIVLVSPSSSPAMPMTKTKNAPTSIECFNFGCRLMHFMNWSASAATPSNTINVETMRNNPHQLSDKARDEILSSIISQRKKEIRSSMQ